MSDMSSSIVMVSARWTCDLKVTASRSRSLHRPICRPFMASHLISHFREVLAKHIPVSKRNSSRHGRIVGRERSETERPICFRTNLNGDIWNLKRNNPVISLCRKLQLHKCAVRTVQFVQNCTLRLTLVVTSGVGSNLYTRDPFSGAKRQKNVWVVSPILYDKSLQRWLTFSFHTILLM